MAITNATLANQIAALVAYWKTRDEEFATWLSGDADGGPYADGRYVLSDWLGTVRYTKSPARLEADVTGLVNSASSYADAAAASATGAASSASAAAGSAAGATTARTAAEAARDLALAYRDTAANSEANAGVHAGNAATSAGEAATDAALANADAIDAAASAAAALASETAAAASAAAAATFNPADYRALANPVPWADLSGVPSTFTPSAHTHAAADITSGELSPSRVRGVQSKDTRAVDSLPYAFPLQALFDFKQRSTLGFTGTGSYGGVVTFAPWGDTSGGPAFQLALSDNSGGPALSIRQSVDAATWGAWKTVSFSDHTHSYLPLTGGTLTGAITFNMAGGNNFIRGGSSDAQDFALLFGSAYDGAANPIIRGFGGSHATLAGRLELSTPVSGSITLGSPLVNFNGTADFGSRTGQHLNLYSTIYGIGIQSGTLYFRSDTNFAWHVGGSHSDTPLSPGGGTLAMSLATSGLNVYAPSVLRAANSHITMYETDAADTADRLLFDLNASIGRVLTYDNSAATWRTHIQCDVSNGNTWLNNMYIRGTDSYLIVPSWIQVPASSGLYTGGGEYFYNRNGDGWNIRGAQSSTNLNYLMLQDSAATARGFLGWSSATVRLHSYADSTGVEFGHGGSYASANIYGSKGGYAGVRFANAYQSRTFMINTGSALGGVYNETSGWDWYYNGGFLTIQNTYKVPKFALSTTSANISRGTAAPSGGADGDIYLQYT